MEACFQTTFFGEIITGLFEEKIFLKNFFKKQASRDCLSFYQNYKQGIRLDSDLDCQAVVFFYRINRMLELSCNALRQQVVNTEQKRLEKEVKVCLF